HIPPTSFLNSRISRRSAYICRFVAVRARSFDVARMTSRVAIAVTKDTIVRLTRTGSGSSGVSRRSKNRSSSGFTRGMDSREVAETLQLLLEFALRVGLFKLRDLVFQHVCDELVDRGVPG